MGRKAGVTAEQTRAELLAAAATVFALKGYDGASIADICGEAGLSTGAVYASYASKAELFVAVLQAHGQRQYRELLGRRTVGDLPEFLTMAGSNYDRRRPADAALLVEAIVASKRDPEVAKLVGSWLDGGEERLTESIREAQQEGVLDAAVDAAAISRLATMLALGSFLTAALEVRPLDHDDWAELIERLVDSFRPASGGTTAPGTA
jgi:AcrR family transcriptional regulator